VDALPHIPVLVGPTCSGKTDVAIELAKALGGEIISADSRQVYRHLTIGTAKPSSAQREAVPHHFVDCREPDQVFTAGEFGIEGRACAEEILARGHLPIVAGGSGLYIRSLTDGLFEGPGSDREIREILEARVAQGQVGELIRELRRVDPETAERADPTKPRRIIRALEVYYLTGKPLSLHHTEHKPQVPFTPVFFGLSWDRKILYERIERRCDRMLDEGLEEEVESLQSRGYDRRLSALNTVGYAEVFAFRAGEISRDEMVRLFRQNSRRYAKRQMTWFRRDTRIRWLDTGPGDPAEVVAERIRRLWTGGDQPGDPGPAERPRS